MTLPVNVQNLNRSTVLRRFETQDVYRKKTADVRHGKDEVWTQVLRHLQVTNSDPQKYEALATTSETTEYKNIQKYFACG